MDISIRRLGLHRGAPRLYLDTLSLERAGFVPGMSIRIEPHPQEERVSIHACPQGQRRVSQKVRGERSRAVIDVNSTADLAPVANLDEVRVVFTVGVIHVLALASRRKAVQRWERLQARLAAGQPLQTAGIAFGAGIASRALHDGLRAGGLPSRVVLANEIRDEVLEAALANNPVLGSTAITINAPMQEAVADDWALRQAPEVDILEAGIPCSGASRAGVAKRGLGCMEQHPVVGHLVAALIQWIAALQPALVLVENVPDYATNASAAILRAWLRDAGYQVAEVVLDARDFGSLEARVRWFLVAHPRQLRLSLEGLAPTVVRRPRLAELLDEVPPDDPSYRSAAHLLAKAERDADKGSGFKLQWLNSDSTSVPTLRRGYHKAGSTDPRLLHPTDLGLSRLLTAREHARIKCIAPEMLDGLSSTLAHEVCGQSVDVRPVQAIGQRIAHALLAPTSTAPGAGAPIAGKVGERCAVVARRQL